MTTPTPSNYLPRLQVDAPPQNAHTGGLYTAATVDPTPLARLDAGVEVTSVNCSTSHGTFPTGCYVEVPEEAEKGGIARAAAKYAPSLIVWASDDCGLVASAEDEARNRAGHMLRLHEQIDVEADTATRLLAEAGTPATFPGGADGVKRAIGAIEYSLGLTGMRGVIHASRALAILCSDWIVEDAGGILRTKLGNRWAFGAGYGDLGNTLVGTGPVTIRRSDVNTEVAVAHRQNQRTVIAERHVNVSWECVTVAQSIV